MNVFALNSFEDVESKTFVLRLSVVSVELSCPQLPFVIHGASAFAPSYRRSPQRPDGFPGRSRLRQHAAALRGTQRPRRGCGAVAEQRRPRGRREHQWPGPQSGKHAPDIESRTWGVSILFFLEILRNMFAFSVNPKHAKNVGINDHM